MSELQAHISVAEWWASERPRIAALFPQRCDEVIAQTSLAMRRARAHGDAHILADAAAMCARAYTGQGEPERGARLIHELLGAAEQQFTAIERAPLIAALGVAYDDKFGHAAGDQALVEIARRLRSALRSGDLVARLGGEEFAVLLPNASAADAQALCERLRDAVAATPVMLANAAHRVTISIGVTTYVPPESTDDALSRADMRLYGAKTAGRNRVIAD